MPNLARCCVTNSTHHVSLPDPIAVVNKTLVTTKSIKNPAGAATGVEVES